MKEFTYYERLEKAIRKNLDKRGMGDIKLKGELKNAAEDLLSSTVVFIVTGFVIRDTLKGETDGPLGAISLAAALEQLGKEVVFITDEYCVDILYKCLELKELNIPIEIISFSNERIFCKKVLEKYKPSHIVAIERPGRALDGCCYSMKGEDISDIVPNTDILFQEAKDQGVVTTAVGDGGNEIGMGKVRHYVENSVPLGHKICAAFSTDYLIIAGVSNWGGHALVAALSLLTNKMLLHDTKVEKQLLENITLVGAVDGCTKKRTLTVDGLSLLENIDVLRLLKNIVNNAFMEKSAITSSSKIGYEQDQYNIDEIIHI